MSGHTPGPYRVAEQNNNWVSVQAQMNDEWFNLAMFYHPPFVAHRDELAATLANANLYAAAPDMLKALQHLTATIDPYSDWNDDGFQAGLRMAAAAIAKAEGRS